MEWAEPVAAWIEGTGVAVMALGALAAILAFAAALLRRLPFEEAYHGFRGNLGRAILLGLEFLVAGDIIATVLVEQTLESAGALALIVAIRTFLSFSLETELEGRFPWRRHEAEGARG